ncbi:redox-regulated ATPase YchF [Opitutales bacterium]|nr:redox-regulated ATPase YchF [Opitutales bacterium]
MMLQSGIVGLPNVGKSTLFNALTKSRKAEAANYPFCTIDPNVGVVQVPDDRLTRLAKIAGTQTIIPAAIEMVDIAGLVAGASKGEGLGNKFLANVREVDAIIHVVRCFEDEDIIHNMGRVDPVNDAEVILTELVLADADSVSSQLQKNAKKARGNDKDAEANVALLEKLIPHLDEGKPANLLEMDEDEVKRLPSFCLLSSKPMLYACNVKEDELADFSTNVHVTNLRNWAAEQQDADSCVISAKMEEELSELGEDDVAEYLEAIGVSDSGVSTLIQSSYNLLGLASFLTAGEKEARAWTFKKGMTAPQCAGVIHTDFEKSFIKAEVVSYDELLEAGSMQAARDAGKLRLEGKEYIFADGDVTLFKCNA